MIDNLPFALQQGKMVSIEDVNRGLACECVCPSCNNVLIAKKGNKNAHHFAHYNPATGFSCENGFETALHLMAKQIIKDNPTMLLPAFDITVSGTDSRHETHTLTETIYPEQFYNLANVDLEKSFKQYIPDVTAELEYDKSVVFIEIAVTHYCGKKKVKFFRENGISAIEIDLAEVRDERGENLTYEGLKGEIQEFLHVKNWLSVGKFKEKKSILKQKLSKLIWKRNQVINDLQKYPLTSKTPPNNKTSIKKETYKPRVRLVYCMNCRNKYEIELRLVGSNNFADCKHCSEKIYVSDVIGH